VCLWTQDNIDAAGYRPYPSENEFPGDNGIVDASPAQRVLEVADGFAYWRIEAADGMPTRPCSTTEPLSMWSNSEVADEWRPNLCRSTRPEDGFALLMLRGGRVAEAVQVWTP